MIPEVEALAAEGKLSDMMTHWYEIRKQYPLEDHIIAYRLGDFYEMFYDDAKKASKLLGLTLTSRGKNETCAPLAGIPYKATQHFKSLLMQGITVVVVEQLEDPKLAVGRVVKRGVVKILSPGTVISEDLLDSNKNNFLCAIYKDKKDSFGFALVELSNSEFYCREFTTKNDKRPLDMLTTFVSNYKPVECILPIELYKDPEFLETLRQASDMIFKQVPAYPFTYENAYSLLCKQFNSKNLDGFGLKDKPCAVSAAGAIMYFLNETQKTEIANITSIKYLFEKDTMIIDGITQKNLELISNLSNGGSFGSLLSIIDRTLTPMGSRKLKTMILQPLTSVEQIDARLNAVEALFNDPFTRNELRTMLSSVGDVIRTISRINFVGTANARDLVSLKNALAVIPKIQDLLKNMDDPLLKSFGDSIISVDNVYYLIQNSIVDNPPVTIVDGGIIKEGYNPKVDEYRKIIENGNTLFQQYEESLKEQIKVKAGLRIDFNNVLGYFIQVTNGVYKQIENNIPEDWELLSQVAAGMRYSTKTLKEMEVKILEAETSIKELEYTIFHQIRKEVARFSESIKNNADIIGLVDIIANFAEVSFQLNYHRPVINDGNQISIVNGRHPVIEVINKSEPFVPNSLLMDDSDHQVLIITGPNWSGKSTYLRQNALIVLMTQLGCFVPADEANIGIVDRIFTRIGASDDLTRGQSTFLMEMNETANILNYANNKSLVIIDELGRGTSTTDGLAIAQATLEKLHDNGVKTLFSTHFHELIELQLPRVSNYHFKILEDGNKLIFLREITSGGTDKSYGIHVALMAGVPQDVIDRSVALVNQNTGSEIYNISNNKENGSAAENTINGKKTTSKKQNGTIAKENDAKTELKQIQSSIIALKKELTGLEVKKNEEQRIIKQIKSKKEEMESEIASLSQNIQDLKEELGNVKQTQSNKRSEKSKQERNTGKTIQSYLFIPDTKKTGELSEDDQKIFKELKDADINSMTPLDALNFLSDLKKRLK